MKRRAGVRPFTDRYSKLELTHSRLSPEWSSILRLVDPSAPEGFDLLFELKRPGTEQLHLPNPKVGDVIVFRKIKVSLVVSQTASLDHVD